MTAHSAAALQLIKSHGPISARSIAKSLQLEEKAARNCIDALRAQGEPIWYDQRHGGFWWRDDQRPNSEAYRRWKRAYSPL